MSDTPNIRARKAWSASAKRTFRELIDANPGIEKDKLSAVYTACDLISEADKMQSVIDADGYTVEGSMGQKVAHPLVAEVRQYRRASLDALKLAGIDARGSSASAAGAALVAKRWNSRPANVTPLKRASSAPF
ncbi:terminase small subunit [Microbacterium phage GardenState]|uniref:Terminase small subunit n=2 Tax=Gardenstatevirus TaxID=3425012 RepID=A0A4Y6E6Z0_9CAUD|nr:terminase small subunit [Microbacterium phage IAmGroot]QOI66913.1 terminase small subunit [Microbacterium phage GardenState]